MKKTLFAILFLLVCGLTAEAQVKVAFVDSEIIIAQLPEAQAVKTQLEGLQKQYVDTITAAETDIKSKADAFKTRYEEAQKQIEAGQLNAEQIRSLEAELGAMQEEVQLLDQQIAIYKQGVQKELMDVQVELFKPVREKITKAIETLAKEMKYNMVFDKASDGLLYGDKEIDITFKVLDKLK